MLVYFILNKMGYMRYYISLIQSLNKENIQCVIFYTGSEKKSNSDKESPIESLEILKEYSKKYLFNIEEFKNFNYNLDILVVVDYCLLDTIYIKNKKFRIININFLISLRGLENFIDKIDYNIYFNTEKIISNSFSYLLKYKSDKRMITTCKTYFKNMNKNRFFQRNHNFKRNSILEKYSLDKKDNFIMIFLPVLRCEKYDKKVFEFIFNHFKDYFFILKTRNKDEYSENIKQGFPKNSIYINDTEWYPHPSLELIFISDFVISTWNSFSVFEAIELNKQCIIIKTNYTSYWTGIMDFLSKKEDLVFFLNKIEDLSKISIYSSNKKIEKFIIENNNFIDLIK